ncbi:MAG: anthranilate phosphoribosyltransferase [Candidatus Sumerlaeia bacterium]|nr:anthranilate phosphoribosyltransferase [Candidatus Sumerlaeia bacterium]
MIREAIGQLVAGDELTGEAARAVALEILSGEATPCQIASFLTALRIRGHTAAHVLGFVQAMREKATRIAAPEGVILDTCGTGGDDLGTFNISTTAMFLAAGAGVRVAKHGNRAMSSRCGSADVLTALGVKIDCSPALSERCLHELGVCFLFAPLYHTAMKHAVQPRREIGHRTIFNLAGPLCNPAGATHQLIGVYDAPLGSMFAEVLRMLGCRRALIVHGADGLDEISVTAPTELTELRDGKIRAWTVTPRDLGFKHTAALADLRAAEDAAGNAAITLAILRGEETGPRAEVALANAGAALYVAEQADTLCEGIELARKALASGAALAKLDALRQMTNLDERKENPSTDSHR